MGGSDLVGDDHSMTCPSRFPDDAAELVDAARRFQGAVQQPGSDVGAPESLASLEQALQMLSAGWYQLAADASPGIVARRRGRSSKGASWPPVDGLSREQEARLMGTLHDVAAAFASCARACREARSTAAPIISRRVAAEGPPERTGGDELYWFDSGRLPTQRVA